MPGLAGHRRLHCTGGPLLTTQPSRNDADRISLLLRSHTSDHLTTLFGGRLAHTLGHPSIDCWIRLRPLRLATMSFLSTNPAMIASSNQLCVPMLPTKLEAMLINRCG